MSTALARGNALNLFVLSLTIDVASVAINTTAEQTFTLKGLLLGDFVMVNKPTLNAGLGVCNARVSAADTIAITFNNNTAGAIDPASMTYTVLVVRPDGAAPTRLPGS